MRRCLIIGAGAAGLSAAARLRELDKYAMITVICPENHPHSRRRLRERLALETDTRGLFFMPNGFFRRDLIELRRGESVRSINILARAAETDAGPISYDRLIIASGAAPVIPDVPGFAGAPNVHGFRCVMDAELIERALANRPGCRALVLGASMAGLSAAAALIRRGVPVTIADGGGEILSGHVADEEAARCREMFERAGAHFRLGARAVSADTAPDGGVASVRLSCGAEVECGVVICAEAIRPNARFLEGSGIDFDEGGIKVDERMRTSKPFIYAAGDVTGLSSGWACAVEQGRVAAANVSGHAECLGEAYRGGCPESSLAGAGCFGLEP